MPYCKQRPCGEILTFNFCWDKQSIWIMVINRSMHNARYEDYMHARLSFIIYIGKNEQITNLNLGYAVYVIVFTLSIR